MRSPDPLLEPFVDALEVMFHQREVTVVLQQPGLHARDVAREPLAVGEGNEPVLPTVEQENRSPYLLELEAPGLEECHVVVPPAIRTGRQPEPCSLIEKLSHRGCEGRAISRREQGLERLVDRLGRRCELLEAVL